MEYNLQNIVPGRIVSNLDIGMPYGEMPSSSIMSKFEETNVGDTGMVNYDSYARTLLTDWGPDTNQFEHEQARGAVNRNYGRLQLQYYGQRGNVDTPWIPETFDQFAGPDDLDPRGINVDPDFKQLVRQRESRNRFQRFNSDMADQITGGGRSEFQVMQDKQSSYRFTRDRLKVFDRQVDGRRTGMNRTNYPHKSNLGKQQKSQGYGDYLRDWAMNPQKTSTIMCREIVRNSKKWRDNTVDSDFITPVYSQICSRGQHDRSAKNDVTRAKIGQDAKSTESEDTVRYKAAGILMADIVRAKRQIAADTDYSESKHTVATKLAPFTVDLSQILREMQADAEFSASDAAGIYKIGVPQRLESQMAYTVYNHCAPAHTYLNADVIYKSVKPGVDTRAIKDLIVGDAARAQIEDTDTRNGRTAKRKMIYGAKLDTSYDTDTTDSDKTCSYKTILSKARSKIGTQNEGADRAESDGSQIRAVDHTNYRNPSTLDVEHGGEYGDNQKQDRLAAPLGTKYTRRQMDTDGARGEISLMN